MGEDEKAAPGPALPYFKPEKNVSKDVLKSALSGASVFSNQVYATGTPQGIRLSFCERHESLDVPAFRAAVFLDYGTAIGLRDLLSDQLQGLEIVTTPTRENPSE
jgi:hypothetical protein